MAEQIQVEVVFALAEKQVLLSVSVDEGATVADRTDYATAAPFPQVPE